MRSLLLAAALLAAGVASAAKYDVEVSVRPERGATDTSPIELTIRVQGSSSPDVESPRLPAMENLRVVSGPSTSQQSSFVFNGLKSEQSAIVTLTYTLRADKAGPASIPSFAIRIDGETYRTRAVRFDVGSGPSGPASSGAAAPEAADDADVFLRSTVGATEVWLGEPILYEVRLYAGTTIAGFRPVPRDFVGFWVEDGGADPASERRRVTIEGRPYTEIVVERRVLVPTSTGTLTIPPQEARFTVPAPRTGDPFADFFRNRFAEVVRKTRAATVKVKPLPEAGRPDDFTGAVGSYRLRVTADRSEAAVNEAIVLRATVEGEGSLHGIPPPALDAPSDLKVFEPKSDESSTVRDGKVHSTKTWEWVLVPLAPGELPAPRVRFPYFDFHAGKYAVAEGAGPTIVARKGTGAAPSPAIPGEIQAQRREIAYVHLDGGAFRTDPRALHEKPWALVLLVVPVLVLPAAALLVRRRAVKLGHRATARALRAGKAARRAFQGAEREIGGELFHARLSRGTYEYLADRLDRSAAGLTREDVEGALAERGVDPELRRRLGAVLDACDFARFAEGADEPERRAALLAEARSIVAALEKLP